MEAENILNEMDKNEAVYEKGSVSMDDLPEEILEQIISNLSPYSDLIAAKSVCKQWHRLVQGISRQKAENFKKAIKESSITWSSVDLYGGPTCTIAERYSHCACYADKSVYVFGGCTSTSTTFNDLWRFDLSARQWIRPLAMGTYPTPKACASLVVYKDELILFGGWNHPSPYPLHQAPRFFNELHTYSLKTNRWSHLFPQVSPRPSAGHSASVVQDKMVVFGGCHSPGLGSNETWVYDFVEKNWEKQNTTLPQPSPRYGQSQLSVDESHIIVIGGCGGPNQIFRDIWLLSLTGGMWTWSEVTVVSPECSPAQLWSHPACQVGDFAVLLSLSSRPMKAAEDSKTEQNPQNAGFINHGRIRTERVWVPPREELPDLDLHSPDNDLDSSDLYPNQDDPDLCQAVGGHSRQDLAGGQDPLPGASSGGGVRNVGNKRKLSTLAQVNAAAASALDSSSDENMDIRPSGRSQRHCFSKTVSPEKPTGDTLNDPQPGTSHEGRRDLSSALHGRDHLSEFETSRQQARRLCGLSLESSNNTPGMHGVRPGLPSVRPNAMKNRTKQLDALRRHADRIKQHLESASEKNANGTQRNARNGNQQALPQPVPVAGAGAGLGNVPRQEKQSKSPVRPPKAPMFPHVLDFSRVVCHGEATWLDVRDTPFRGAPEETVFYSLVAGRGELLMFGGIQKDLTSMQIGVDIDSHVVRKDLYVISAQKEPLR